MGAANGVGIVVQHDAGGTPSWATRQEMGRLREAALRDVLDAARECQMLLETVLVAQAPHLLTLAKEAGAVPEPADLGALPDRVRGRLREVDEGHLVALLVDGLPLLQAEDLSFFLSRAGEGTDLLVVNGPVSPDATIVVLRTAEGSSEYPLGVPAAEVARSARSRGQSVERYTHEAGLRLDDEEALPRILTSSRRNRTKALLQEWGTGHRAPEGAGP